MSDYLPEGKRIHDRENQAILQSSRLLHEAAQNGDILEARAVLCDAAHNLTVDLGCMQGVIPREDGAIGIREGSVRDIAVISRVNRPVCFVVTGFSHDENGREIALLSREKAQRRCLEGYVRQLRRGDVVDAKITHLESFGAFADIGCGIVALMPIDAISVSRIEHPKERFSVGMDIRAVIRGVQNGRISLSHKELLGTWEENAAFFRPKCGELRRFCRVGAESRRTCRKPRRSTRRSAGERVHQEHPARQDEDQADHHRHI